MNFSSIFILRPVMTTLVMFALAAFGVIAYFQLPVNDLPNVDFPTIMVQASLPGANADTMSSAIATPLEREFSTIAGLDSMNSTSSLGSTQITLQFNPDRKLDGAAQDVQAAIVAARAYLPANMPSPPTYRKVNPADMPVLYIALSSPTLPLYTVDDYAENILANEISMVSGVAQVQVYGSQIYAVHVRTDPEKLSAQNIGIDEVVTAVRNNNVNLPLGTLWGDYKSYVVQANGQLYNAAAYMPLIVAYRNGAPIRIRDIGTAIDSVQNDKVASWYCQRRAIILAVQRQPNTNTIQIVDNIKNLLPSFKAILPASIDLNIMYDRSVSIRHSVSDVQLTLLLTVVLVVMVIYLFLGSKRATIIPSLALPISILGTFGAMYMFNFSINTISLIAITLSVGFVVDDAIVMLENIVRHMEAGEDPKTAALKGSKEIGFTILSMTLSLVAVFIPILCLGSLIGKLFREFAVSISVAILISGFVSLTLTPMLCSRYLRLRTKENSKQEHDALDTATSMSNVYFHKLRDSYARALKFALRHRGLITIAFFGMIGATAAVFMYMPKGFLPNEDTGSVFCMTDAPQGISFDSMVDHQQKVAQTVGADPNVQSYMSSVGGGGPSPSLNSGRVFIVLKSRPERKLSIDEFIKEMRPKLAKIPGIKLYMQNRPSINVGGQQTKGVYQYSLYSPNTHELYASAKELEKKLKQIPGLQDVNSDLQIKNLQINLNIDRDKCSQLGITMGQLQDALNSAYSARQISTIFTSDNEFWVISEVEPKFYRSPESLNALYIRSSSGGLIPLSTVATLSQGVGPLLINHVGQFPSVTLSFNLKEGVSLSQAINDVNKAASEILSPEVNTSFQGTAQQFVSSNQNLPLLLLVSILVIYITLGILYESFIHPITILSGLPSAGLGALLALMICNMELNIYGYLGLVLLIGIVKKNAIMMIDFALDYERSKKSTAEEAIYEACIARFRPIMMTTMAAIMGSLPIAIGFGQGSESRQSLGISIVGGLMFSQLVTLFITPVFYVFLDGLSKRFYKPRIISGLRQMGHELK